MFNANTIKMISHSKNMAFYRLRLAKYNVCNSVRGVFSKRAARFWPSPFFTQCPQTRNAHPSITCNIKIYIRINRNRSSSVLEKKEQFKKKVQKKRTFRSTLTRYGSFNESSIRNGSNVYLNRLIRTIARTHNIAYWNFLRALN